MIIQSMGPATSPQTHPPKFTNTHHTNIYLFRYIPPTSLFLRSIFLFFQNNIFLIKGSVSVLFFKDTLVLWATLRKDPLCNYLEHLLEVLSEPFLESKNLSIPIEVAESADLGQALDWRRPSTICLLIPSVVRFTIKKAFTFSLSIAWVCCSHVG